MKKRSKFEKKKSNLPWIVLTILIIVIIVFVLLLLLTPNNEQRSQCTQKGLYCFTESCPSNYSQVNYNCSTGKVCCEKSTINPKNCTGEGKNKSVRDPNCCSGLEEVTGTLLGEPTPISLRWCVNCGNGICDSHENWYNCQEDCKKSIVYGFVSLKQGNCMPPVGPDCNSTLISTQVAVFPKVNPADMNGTYYRTSIGPIKMVNSNVRGILGYYEIELPIGDYSIFARDPTTGDYYCNLFTGYEGTEQLVCPISIFPEPSNRDIVIDHAVY